MIKCCFDHENRSRLRPVEKSRMVEIDQLKRAVVDVDQLQNSRMVDVDGCLFLSRQQSALFITPKSAIAIDSPNKIGKNRQLCKALDVFFF